MATKRQRLYQKLKQDLLAGKFNKEQPIRQAEIAAHYQVSRIPVRDVLQQLKAEGWLSEHGKCGVIPTPLDAREAEDLYLMRAQLEPMLLEMAIPRINNQGLGLAQDLLEQIEQCTQDQQQYGQLNWQFHACLYQAAQRPTLFSTLEYLHNQCSRYIGYQSLAMGYDHTSQDEHYALLELIRVKDTDAAKLLLKEHIQAAGKIICQHLQHSAPKN